MRADLYFCSLTNLNLIKKEPLFPCFEAFLCMSSTSRNSLVLFLLQAQLLLRYSFMLVPGYSRCIFPDLQHSAAWTSEELDRKVAGRLFKMADNSLVVLGRFEALRCACCQTAQSNTHYSESLFTPPLQEHAHSVKSDITPA